MDRIGASLLRKWAGKSPGCARQCTFHSLNLFLMRWQLFYNIVLASAVQQCESTVNIHILPPSWLSLPLPHPTLPSRSWQSTDLSSLHYTQLWVCTRALLSCVPLFCPKCIRIHWHDNLPVYLFCPLPSLSETDLKRFLSKYIYSIKLIKF